ncbi:MAG TPA: YcxB family protein [Acidimicrobiales bacterium]|nr:YcxB family protein [Acidimicrobiales bacterium]
MKVALAEPIEISYEVNRDDLRHIASSTRFGIRTWPYLVLALLTIALGILLLPTAEYEAILCFPVGAFGFLVIAGRRQIAALVVPRLSPARNLVGREVGATLTQQEIVVRKGSSTAAYGWDRVIAMNETPDGFALYLHANGSAELWIPRRGLQSSVDEGELSNIAQQLE